MTTTRTQPITGAEFEAAWSEHWLTWAREDIERADPRPMVTTQRRPAASRAAEVQRAPQASARAEQPRRLTYQERLARLEALVGPMRAMPMPRSMLEPSAPANFQAHLMRLWRTR